MNTIEKQTKKASIILGIFATAIILTVLNTGCGTDPSFSSPKDFPQLGTQEDDSVVRGIAVLTVESEQQTAMNKMIEGFKNLFMIPEAKAVSTATTTVTYNNAASVTFTLNAATFTAGTFTGNTLSLGSFTITALRDNNLKVCTPGGTTKCTTAILRVYSTGTVTGFVNTTDGTYGAPIFTSGLNPTTALVLATPGTPIDQINGMATTKHTVNLADFSTPTHTVTSDFTDAGSGNYSVTFVVEYALAP